jgi:hypothetical protein
MEKRLRILVIMNYFNAFLSFVISLSFSNCTGKPVKSNLSSDKVDSSEIVLNKPSDSATIFILTPDGKVVKELKYYKEEKRGEFQNYIKGYPKTDTLTGDFNGDGIIEQVWSEMDYKRFLECQGKGDKKSCQEIFRFSDNKIAPLFVDYCPMYTFKNEGDLNGDGKDEIGILPGWYASGCRQYQVYTFRKNKWIEVCEPIGNSYNMREAGIVLIEKDIVKNGYVIIRQSVDSFMGHPENKISSEYYLGSSCAWSNVVERNIKLE